MSEMKLIMENFRKFSEQVCDGGDTGECVSKVTETEASLTSDINKINKYLNSPKLPEAYKKSLREALANKIAKLEQLKSQQVNEAGETGPDPLGLRDFGNISEIPGFQFFEGESMENNQKIYRYRFANLKSAQVGKEYTERAATNSTENKRMLASKKISLVSAEILPSSKAGFGLAINEPTELRVTWNVGRAAKEEAPEPIPVAPASSPI